MSQRSRTDLCGGCRATGIPTATSRVPFQQNFLSQSPGVKGYAFVQPGEQIAVDKQLPSGMSSNCKPRSSRATLRRVEN